MDVDVATPAHARFAALRTALNEDFALQTARLEELTRMRADPGDPGEAHHQAALLAATRLNLERITGALRRIARGTYGSCEKCESPIPVERLEVLPHAQCCVPCQETHHG
jgi:DnaK suppressor protein